MTLRIVFALFLLGLAPLTVHALESDKDQPATLDADEFDLDFQTGVRTYRGNVVYQQGSIKLTADEIVAHFSDGSLERAVARGNPAKFKQRQEGKTVDTVGVGKRIELNELTNLVLLERNASVTQGDNTIAGRKITYDMLTEKVKVRSGGSKQKKAPTANAAATTAGDTAAGNAAAPVEAVESSRPRLVIKPRQN